MTLAPDLLRHHLGPVEPPPQRPLRDAGLGGDGSHCGTERQAPSRGMTHAGNGKLPIGSWLAGPLGRYAQGTPVRNGTPIGYFSHHLGR